MKSDSWLGKVAKILRAETGDLRRLAELGGADPRTLFIGTRLDGVDIRGQDLRGILLPGLDLAKVQHDENTRLDTEPAAEEVLPSSVETVIYLASTRLNPQSLLRSRGGATAMLFEIGDEVEFLRAAVNTIGAVILVVAPEDARPALHVASKLREMSIFFVTIAADRVRSRWSAYENDALVQSLEPLVRILPAQGFQVSQDTASVETRDMIGLLSDQWGLARDFTSGFPEHVFLRAKGIGPRPMVDACAQIYDRGWRANTLPSEVTLVGYFGQTQRGGPGGLDACFELLRARQVFDLPPMGPKKQSFDVAILAESDQGRRDDETYFNELSHAVQKLTGRYALARDWYRHVDGRELAFQTISSKSKPPKIVGTPSTQTLREFSFHQIETIILSDNADIGTVVDRLIGRRELWITGRDLLAALPHGGSFWSLIAAQLRRTLKAMIGPYRQYYLELLVRAAFQSDSVDLESDWDRWIDALADNHFSEVYRLSMAKLTASDEGANCRIRLEAQYPGTRRRGFDQPLEAMLWISDHGISLTDIGREPNRPGRRIAA